MPTAELQQVGGLNLISRLCASPLQTGLGLLKSFEYMSSFFMGCYNGRVILQVSLLAPLKCIYSIGMTVFVLH